MHPGERFNSFTHLAGVVAAIVGAPLLVWPALLAGHGWKIAGLSIYAFCLIALYLFSTLYHSTRGQHKALFRHLDHLAIYLLIAGTYTPFLLVTLRGGNGWWMFGVIWLLAVVGMVLESVSSSQRRRLWSIPIYLLMGWLSLLLIKPLFAALPAAGFNLLLLGGVAYTSGIIFYALDKKISYFHGIWHLFVLAGSVCHYLTIYYYVA